MDNLDSRPENAPIAHLVLFFWSIRDTPPFRYHRIPLSFVFPNHYRPPAIAVFPRRSSPFVFVKSLRVPLARSGNSGLVFE